MIAEEWVTEFVDKHREILVKLSPSFFEMTVAMAFDYFSRKKKTWEFEGGSMSPERP